jgi:lysophospholipase L1-like esterase
LQKIVTLIKESLSGQNACAPKILIICPPPITENLHPEFNDDAIKKSKELSKLYFDLSIEMQFEFLDSGLYIQSSMIDGIHLDSNSCNIIGNRIAEKVILMKV